MSRLWLQLALGVDLYLVDHLAKVFETGLDGADLFGDCAVLGIGPLLRFFFAIDQVD